MGYEANTGTGSTAHYGPRTVESKFGGQMPGAGLVKQAVWVFDLANASYTVQSGAATIALLNPGSTANHMQQIIPAYSTILSARADVLEALASTGMSAAANIDLLVGLDNASTGAAIDADGLIDATDGAVTISSFNIAHAQGDSFVGMSAALIRNYQYDGDATGDPVDVTAVQGADIGSADARLYAALSVDDDTGLTGLSGKLRVFVEYLPNA